ncbi:class II aldolase/adducin family protein [Haloterrigena sp. SYSU A121-1]|uniref:Class II aldolase/adducin family protein n=1 Tax=Haloterrigena gelatinilytica TaxID=2741724 RepID=A0A8J8KHE6_9EURY|nr:class II aldolase/adducin family protein [Haloterrigena gelatinilytica]NUB93446.1 class II aldolase/adducin family protein [Haloterrigena gelatinilytica]
MVSGDTSTTAKREVVEKGVEILEEGLTQRTSGNVSVRIDDDYVAISPSGVPYREIAIDDVPVVNMNGEVVDDGREPSSETPMHLAAYRNRDDIDAIVHTHSPYATTFAALGRPIDPAHYLIAFAGKSIEAAEYATNGTPELGENAVAALGDRNAVLLRNHGVLAVGPTLDDAHNVASRVEYCARIQYQAEQLGEPELVDDAELDDLIEYFQEYD